MSVKVVAMLMAAPIVLRLVLLDAHSLPVRDRAWNAESRWIEGWRAGVFEVRQVEPPQCVDIQDDHASSRRSSATTGRLTTQGRDVRRLMIGAAGVGPRVAAS